MSETLCRMLFVFEVVFIVPKYCVMEATNYFYWFFDRGELWPTGTFWHSPRGRVGPCQISPSHPFANLAQFFILDVFQCFSLRNIDHREKLKHTIIGWNFARNPNLQLDFDYLMNFMVFKWPGPKNKYLKLYISIHIDAKAMKFSALKFSQNLDLMYIYICSAKMSLWPWPS